MSFPSFLKKNEFGYVQKPTDEWKQSHRRESSLFKKYWLIILFADKLCAPGQFCSELHLLSDLLTGQHLTQALLLGTDFHSNCSCSSLCYNHGTPGKTSSSPPQATSDTPTNPALPITLLPPKRRSSRALSPSPRPDWVKVLPGPRHLWGWLPAFTYTFEDVQWIFFTTTCPICRRRLWIRIV